jgi:hypothetical protein
MNMHAPSSQPNLSTMTAVSLSCGHRDRSRAACRVFGEHKLRSSSRERKGGGRKDGISPTSHCPTLKSKGRQKNPGRHGASTSTSVWLCLMKKKKGKGEGKTR